MQIDNPLVAQPKTDALLGGLVTEMRHFASRLAQLEQQFEPGAGPRASYVGANDTRLDDLRRLLEEPDVEPYQPIYGVTGLLPGEPRRGCVDRCRAIEHFLGPVHDLRMLDIGSSLGYMSFHYAARGASVSGWEAHDKNVEASRQIAGINGIDVDFDVARFDNESVQTIAENSYDVVLLLSVVHHLVNSDGLGSVQALMAELLRRVPTVIVELAQKGEDPALIWDSAQPDDDLAIFERVRDNVEIVKLGEFGTHLSDQPRPIYAVTLLSNTIAVNGTDYRYDTRSVAAYTGSPVPMIRARRRYYFDSEHVVKEYDFDGDFEHDNRAQIEAEIATLTRLAGRPGIPVLLDYELSPAGARLALKRTAGSLLVDLLGIDLGVPEARVIAEHVLRALAELERVGLNHNDVRSWNVIYDGETASLIDYGRSSDEVTDDDAPALLWLLKAVISGKREDFDPRQDSLPPLELFDVDAGLTELFLAVASGERSPSALLRVLAQAG